MRRSVVAALIAASLVVASSTFVAPLGAASPTGGWPAWTITPEDPTAANHEGTISFGLPGMPDATYTASKEDADGQGTELEPNEDEFIAAGTPFGQVFGASGPSTDTQFLKVRLNNFFSPTATTTITFASPVPAGVLGFAVGDVDVDQVQVSGTQPGGAPISGAELAGSPFNLCDTVGAPPDCDGVTPPFPTPSWDPATGIVLGSGDDTDGEAAWFRPTVSVQSLTLVYSVQGEGFAPSYRLWLAALQSSVGGTVASTCAAATQPVQLTLLGPGGDTIETVATAADGTYAFSPVLAVDGYAVGVDVPAGCTLQESNPTTVSLADGDATVNFTLTGEAAPTPATPRYTG